MDQAMITYVIGGVLLLTIIFLIVWLYSFERRLKQLFRGKNGRDIESAVNEINSLITQMSAEQKEVEKILENHNARIHHSVRGLHTIRFNPFPNAGGQQSFATALLNETGDGVVISSLYARDRMSVFAKPITHFKSEYELTDEERDALAKAKSQMM